MPRFLRFPHLATTLFCAALLPSACALDEGKGEEDESFDVYEDKADSFRNPTEHGALLFGTPQEARLGDNSLYHSWDFELTDDAEVSLETLLDTANLDTVMYLYKKNTETGQFGSYKFKNDDANKETVASKLEKKLEKGQYRVLIKGFKSSLRGSFRLSASCEGAGCTSSTCDLESFSGFLVENGESCGELFSAALNTDLAARSGAVITLDERCSLPLFAQSAVEGYVEYFSDFGGFGSGDPDELVEINVNWDVYENGASYVSVDTFGDEDGLDFLVNPDNQVIAHYQHNQSPDHTLYCDSGVEFLEDGECFFSYVESFPHAASDERSFSASVKANNAESELEGPAFLAYQAYVAELGLSTGTTVHVDATIWDIGSGESAGRITVKASNKRKYIYELSALRSTQWQYTVKRGASDAQYDCREL
ncbi:MAG: hypothetical protein JKY56_13645 [Kofleriaceae bacterium]|nr:hypothetical protein [Kofleriaceae bacterium]